MNNHYLNVSWKLRQKHLQMGVSLPSPPTPPYKIWNLYLLSDFDEIWYETSLFEFKFKIETKIWVWG